MINLHERIKSVILNRGGMEFTELVLTLYSEDTEVSKEQIALVCSDLCGRQEIFFVSTAIGDKKKQFLFPIEATIEVHKQ